MDESRPLSNFSHASGGVSFSRQEMNGAFGEVGDQLKLSPKGFDDAPERADPDFLPGFSFRSTLIVRKRRAEFFLRQAGLPSHLGHEHFRQNFLGLQVRPSQTFRGHLGFEFFEVFDHEVFLPCWISCKCLSMRSSA